MKLPRDRHDILAGVSVAGLLLPEAVAYSGIAGLEPQHAIFAAVAGLLFYALVGNSRFAVVAPTSSSAAILAAAVATIPNAQPIQREALAYAAVLLTGGFFLIAGFARLGHLANFISRPVLRGFAFGLAVTIVARQLPIVAGVHVTGSDPFHVLAGLFSVSAQWNLWSCAIGAIALAALVALRPFPLLPGAFIVLVAGIAATYLFDMNAHQVAVVGAIDARPALPAIPDIEWRQWMQLAEVSLPLFLIIYAESWGSMRNLALRHNDSLDNNRELLALGAANLASGLMRGMPVGAGFSASSANEAAGARSVYAGVCAAIAIVILIALANGYIARLPEPVLAAVVIAALLHALDPAPLMRLWRIDRDQYVALSAALAVMVLGVVNGMLAAIALSIAAMVRRFSSSRIVRLGRLGDTHDFVDCGHHPAALQHPEIAILRPLEPLFFANAERIFANVSKEVVADANVRVLIISVEETPDLDSTAIDALFEFEKRQTDRGRILLIARIKENMRGALTRAGADEMAQTRSFLSVADAFEAALARLKT